MKVGTDGVLLGAWATCENAESILDIGTGTGLIALQLAQRSKAIIDAIEIDETAALQAKENVENSPWANRINILAQSFQDFSSNCKKQYDLLVSNPPYFENSLKSANDKKNKARHTDSLSPEEILHRSKTLLSKNGRLCLILPVKEAEKFLLLGKENGWYCEQKTAVIPRIGSQAKRALIALKQGAGICYENELIIETAERHAYSAAYKQLTKDFYLNF